MDHCPFSQTYMSDIWTSFIAFSSKNFLCRTFQQKKIRGVQICSNKTARSNETARLSLRRDENIDDISNALKQSAKISPKLYKKHPKMKGAETCSNE